jgi:hypothetical protein
MNTETELYDLHENFSMVEYRMRQEGIEYCFEHYSSFSEIKDEKFHELRLELLEKIKSIRNYVREQIEVLDEKINELE